MALFDETARMRALSLFLSSRVEEEHVNEVARKAGISQGVSSVALRALEKEGLLSGRKVGNAVFFRLDTGNVLARRLKTDWLLQALLEGKEKFEREEYQSVALYGSCALGTFGRKSDIDILVITSLPKEKVFSRLAGAGKAAGMEVSPVVMPISKWQRMAGEGDRFYKEVIANHVLLHGVALAV